ncbi:hypothetical protein [Microbulbifer guangxiensis]|uniref:hypothetical protein n=1 Tax=Microbulbifer guangxiensis TaxID=2904249 RepID=UPI001F1FA744|nr:hypothetical protein [Microbulbifer guangxiensis]
MDRKSKLIKVMGLAAVAIMIAILAAYIFILVKIRAEIPVGIFILLQGLGVVSALILVRPLLMKNGSKAETRNPSAANKP